MPRPTTEEELRKRRCSANRNFSVLKAILNRAFADGKVPSDAAWRPVLPFKRAITSKRQFLTFAECRALIKQLAPDSARFVQGALHTGARFSELARATASDFDEATGSLHLPPSKTFRARRVMLTEEATTFFADIVRNISPTDPIFRRSDGCPWSLTDPYPRLNMACQMAGVPRITFHCLRHTYASLMAMSGVPIQVIAKNLGHTDTVACERYYAHLQPSYVADTIRAKMPLFNFNAGGGSPQIGVESVAS